MRFSKAPLIATLMAVVLSLLVILPALAENTDGQVYQGRTLSDELIVGVFADVADSQGGDAPVALGVSSTSDAYMVGDDAANPEDTFFNGRLYVSNQAKAFNTVLVTHLVNITDPLNCVAVEIRNENTGSKISLQLVPTSANPGPTPPRPNTVYYQNYFRLWIVTARPRWRTTTVRAFVLRMPWMHRPHFSRTDDMKTDQEDDEAH